MITWRIPEGDFFYDCATVHQCGCQATLRKTLFCFRVFSFANEGLTCFLLFPLSCIIVVATEALNSTNGIVDILTFLYNTQAFIIKTFK